MKEIEGDLIKMALEGHFDVIAHGCNCFCNMGAGIAVQMAKTFGCDKFPMECAIFEGEYDKLGTVDYRNMYIEHGKAVDVFDCNRTDSNKLIVANCYTQFHYGRKFGVPFNYLAFQLCMNKLNYAFRGKRIGLPKIGAGLAGGNWSVISRIIKEELIDCDVTIVKLKEV